MLCTCSVQCVLISPSLSPVCSQSPVSLHTTSPLYCTVWRVGSGMRLVSMPTYQTLSWTRSTPSMTVRGNANRLSVTPSSLTTQHHPGIWWHTHSIRRGKMTVTEHWNIYSSCSPQVYMHIILYTCCTCCIMDRYSTCACTSTALTD